MPDLPRRRDRLPSARGAGARGGDDHDPRSRKPERNLRQSAAHRVGGPPGRRRGTDRQVPTDLPPTMSTVATRTRGQEAPEARLRTIGAVCEELRSAFPDISVSKIRYLEDQGLITPRRTRGGYRLFSPEADERLATILRLRPYQF